MFSITEVANNLGISKQAIYKQKVKLVEQRFNGCQFFWKV